MEHDKPYELIDKIFSYLHRTKIKCVLRMDEIEQMLEDKGMLGNLLTLFNNLNTPKGYTINGAIVATANNITDIITKAPQFFRHGRWNEKFFVSFPTNEDSIKIMQYYTKRYNVSFSGLKQTCGKMISTEEQEEILFEILMLANQKYGTYNIAKNENKFVYAPSEIDYLFERLSHITIKNMFDIEKEVDVVVPLQITASKGVFDMYSEAQKLAFKDLNKG
jgi:SpoVK/Ycf46/Vps4 family AAA+-type ATPase